jgi:hypothetical protein
MATSYLCFSFFSLNCSCIADFTQISYTEQVFVKTSEQTNKVQLHKPNRSQRDATSSSQAPTKACKLQSMGQISISAFFVVK